MRILLAVVAVLALAVTAAPAGATPDVQTTTGRSQPIYDEFVTETYRVPTEHGTIYGQLVRPVVPDDVKVPVILTYSPYNVLREPNIARDSTARFFTPRGYARATFDVVGTRQSSGCYDYGGIRERETGAALIDFLGTQPWSNGKVGMIGGSYDGTTQIAAAIEAPEHLAAIIPQVAIDRWYDYAYGGGIRYFLNSERPTDEGFDTPLAFDFGFGLLPHADVEATLAHVTPCDQLEHTQRGYDLDPVYDEFWAERDYRRHADKVEAAVFIEGGWLDHNVKHWDSTRFFEALPADHPKKLVMGQWAHSASRFTDAQDLRHAWFDQWLLGLDTGIMDLPPVDTQVNTGERMQEEAWPPAGTQAVEVSLDALEGDGDTFTDANPALTEEQVFEGLDLGAALTFRSEPLATDVRISGGPVLDLLATSTATSTHYTPVVFDEAPDGTRELITRGFLNARNRNGLDVSEPLVPGEAYRAPVDLWDVDWVLPAGHRLGVVVMSSNAAWALPDDTRATNTLDLDASVLRLPVSSGAEALAAEDDAACEHPGGARVPEHARERFCASRR
jgi:X-Pro dipeptidyl-peptidase